MRKGIYKKFAGCPFNFQRRDDVTYFPQANIVGRMSFNGEEEI
jgi:hypothetical protein